MCGCFSCLKSEVQHFRPRLEKTIPQEQACDICGTYSWDVAYCAFCKKWLCKACAKDPLKRFKAMVKEKVFKEKRQ